MATSNFHNVNATNIFAVELESDIDYIVLFENLQLEFESDSRFGKFGKRDMHDLRSYPSQVLGSLRESVMLYDDEVEVFVSPVIRSGYYEGCNLDWVVQVYVNGDDDDSLNDSPTVQAIISRLSGAVEDIFKMYSDSYVVTARFSNGETIYSKVD